ncbi:MAG: hypothetical protein ACAH95_01555 [Fimbriimonas sp.]
MARPAWLDGTRMRSVATRSGLAVTTTGEPTALWVIVNAKHKES